MRTSRISRDTSRILSASTRATTEPARRTRASVARLREFGLDGDAAENVTNGVGKEETDSELSSVPSEGDEEEVLTTASRKRKRGHNGVVTKSAYFQETENVAIKKEALLETANDKPKKTRRVPAKKKVAADGTVKVEPPSNWEEVYALTKQMREATIAPVDTMGCATLADRSASPRDQRFQTLVALMLSSQTKDTVTSAAIWDMQKNMPGGFNLESVLAIEPPALNSFICKVGFHNLKTKYIKQTAEILRDKWDSDIPPTIDGLTSLPGVGPKMAYLCMSAAWGRDEGIGVDVHVHRITNLWGWHKTKQPEETRKALESWLPKDKWNDINHLLVGFGQTICLPVGRKCGDCKLAERRLCPSAIVGRAKKMKKEEVVVKDGDDESRLILQKTKFEEREIKLEEIEEAKMDVLDIEDIGKASRRSPFG